MMQQLASYARNANEKLSVDAFQSGNENENNVEEEEDQSEEAKKEGLKMMNELLDEFDDDIDRIKAAGVPKPVVLSVLGFLIYS